MSGTPFYRPSAPRRRRWGVWLLSLVALLALLPIAIIALYRFVPPPVTPLMLLRAAEGETMRRDWVAYGRIAPALPRAVIASEDARFCGHHGFDWIEIDRAYADWQEGEKLRGASTISQQVAKNLFLWPGRSFIRKGIEAYLTFFIEALWSKERILETYLNSVEWGHGIYGAEAASRLYFNRPAAQLTQHESALLAAVLPNPRRWAADHPTPYISERAATIVARMPDVVIPGRSCR
jgi:monofunctional glycosyltransferase